MGSASRGWETCARAGPDPTVTADYYINLDYQSQDHSTSIRGYKPSPPGSKCSAGLFRRSALRSLCLPKGARHLQTTGGGRHADGRGGASFGAATFPASANMSARKGK